MEQILDILIRVGVSIVVLLVLTRLDGAKQISQLNFFDYIVGITVGSIAGALAVDTEIDILHGVLAIAIYLLTSLFLSFLTNKSIVARRILEGNPIFLIAKGEILKKGLSSARFSLNDLLRELRVQGYFDLSEVNYAILESNGTVSIMPKASARPLQLQDFPEKMEADSSINANVVVDGKILHANLKAFQKDKEWLLQKLKEQNVNLKDAMLVTLDDDGQLSIHEKNLQKNGRTSLT